MKQLFVGSDHAGFSLKKNLLSQLAAEFPDWKVEDRGTQDTSSVDYPVFAKRVADKVIAHQARGILVCGSGIGMGIAANKVAGVRASVAWDVTSARLSREHNNSNILCLGERLLGAEVAREILRVWLTTEFLHGRHIRRMELISEMEA